MHPLTRMRTNSRACRISKCYHRTDAGKHADGSIVNEDLTGFHMIHMTHSSGMYGS